MRRAPARPVRACSARSCCNVVVQAHDLRATPVQRNAKRRLSSHFTLHSSHFTLHTSSHLRSCELFSPHLTSSQLFSSHPISSHMSSKKVLLNCFHLIRALINLSHLSEQAALPCPLPFPEAPRQAAALPCLLSFQSNCYACQLSCIMFTTYLCACIKTLFWEFCLPCHA